MSTLEFKKPVIKKKKKKATAAKSKKKGAGIERRVVKRLPVKMLVDYRSREGNYLFDFSYNLGSGGIFINTKKPYPLDSDIKLMFTLPNTETSFEVQGKVTWHQPILSQKDAPSPGMGIQFVGLTIEQRKILSDYVDSLEKPAIVEETA